MMVKSGEEDAAAGSNDWTPQTWLCTNVRDRHVDICIVKRISEGRVQNEKRRYDDQNVEEDY